MNCTMSEHDAAQTPYVPLAARMRPRVPEQFFGQEHLLGDDLAHAQHLRREA